MEYRNVTDMYTVLRRAYRWGFIARDEFLGDRLFDDVHDAEAWVICEWQAGRVAELFFVNGANPDMGWYGCYDRGRMVLAADDELIRDMDYSVCAFNPATYDSWPGQEWQEWVEYVNEPFEWHLDHEREAFASLGY